MLPLHKSRSSSIEMYVFSEFFFCRLWELFSFSPSMLVTKFSDPFFFEVQICNGHFQEDSCERHLSGSSGGSAQLPERFTMDTVKCETSSAVSTPRSPNDSSDLDSKGFIIFY